jgi:hypothetical protein
VAVLLVACSLVLTSTELFARLQATTARLRRSALESGGGSGAAPAAAAPPPSLRAGACPASNWSSLYMLHIPKAGGTSLRNFLMTNLRQQSKRPWCGQPLELFPYNCFSMTEGGAPGRPPAWRRPPAGLACRAPRPLARGLHSPLRLPPAPLPSPDSPARRLPPQLHVPVHQDLLRLLLALRHHAAERAAGGGHVARGDRCVPAPPGGPIHQRVQAHPGRAVQVGGAAGCSLLRAAGLGAAAAA